MRKMIPTHNCIVIVTLIIARKKGVDCFNVETPGLLTDKFFHGGILHSIVTC